MARKFLWKALTAGAVTLLAADCALRRWFLSWGATKDEIKKTLPGDELCPEAASVATHAVTIQAPAEEVWPWLAQIGQDRGGFYSYSWLENLVGAQIRNADHLLPGLPTREVGETVWLTTPHRYGGRAFLRVAQVEPCRYMVLVSAEDFESIARTGRSPGGAWSFILEPVDEHTTRFLIRSRSGSSAGPGRFLVFDPIHFIMERKMMLGLRDRVEATTAQVAA